MSKEWSWKTFWNSGLPYQGPDSEPAPSVEDWEEDWSGMQMASRTPVAPDTHIDMWGKRVSDKLSGESATNARVTLGMIGALTLVAGIIMLIASFNTTSLASAHTALVSLVCGSLLTLIGSIAVIALLAVKANAES